MNLNDFLKALQDEGMDLHLDGSGANCKGVDLTEDDLLYIDGLPLGGGPYHQGGLLGVVNANCLSDKYEVCAAYTDRFGGTMLYILVDFEADYPAELVEELVALRDYPLVDEDAYSEAETTLMLDSLDSYGYADVASAVGDLLAEECEHLCGYDIVEALDLEQVLRDLEFEWFEYGHIEQVDWYIDIDRAAKAIVESGDLDLTAVETEEAAAQAEYEAEEAAAQAEYEAEEAAAQAEYEAEQGARTACFDYIESRREA